MECPTISRAYRRGWFVSITKNDSPSDAQWDEILLAVKRVNKSDKIAGKGKSAVQGCHASVLIGNGNAITMAGMAILKFIEGGTLPIAVTSPRSQMTHQLQEDTPAAAGNASRPRPCRRSRFPKAWPPRACWPTLRSRSTRMPCRCTGRRRSSSVSAWTFPVRRWRTG